MKLGDGFKPLPSTDALSTLNLGAMDLWVLSKLATATKIVQESMAIYDFSSATTAVYQFWLYELCDVYLV